MQRPAQLQPRNMALWPAFYFQMDAIEARGAGRTRDGWDPGTRNHVLTRPGTASAPLSNRVFHCNMVNIYEPANYPPLYLFSVVSVYYSNNRYYISPHDVVEDLDQPYWNHPLRFSQNPQQGSLSRVSTASITGNTWRPSHARADQRWLEQLDIPRPENMGNWQDCGINGDVSLLLALIYLSVQPALVERFLTTQYSNGRWRWPEVETYQRYGLGNHARREERGVRVRIFCSSSQEHDNLLRRQRAGPLLF